MSGYTVIDVETTGFSPRQHDRIVEIAAVYVSETGQIEGEWATLVNPGRDVGPTREFTGSQPRMFSMPRGSPTSRRIYLGR